MHKSHHVSVLLYHLVCPAPYRRILAAVLQQSRVLAYPNTFAETFCIAALEAQAAAPYLYDRLAAEWEQRLRILQSQRAAAPSTSADEAPFLPTGTTVTTMVNGYPKTLILSTPLLRRHYAEALRHAGLPKCAAALRNQ